MSEENTTENQAPIDPELSASSELEDGELSEEELDAQSGGTFQASTQFQDPAGIFQGDVKIFNVNNNPAVQTSTDSSYSSHLGATGANNGSELAHANAMALNMTARFP
jgi:hypothetical protein